MHETKRRTFSFNPTLVRLRPGDPDPGNRLPLPFQSHAGSIEAGKPRDGSRSSWPCFNPTLVRLRPVELLPVVPLVLFGFNPTLVRLRRFVIGRVRLQATAFQSHAGSIEALWIRKNGPGSLLFQSHAGSIEAELVQ